MKINKYYIRFGDIPKNEKSNKYIHGELFGSEIGVSVYDAVKMNGVWSVVLPVKVNENTIITYNILRLYQKMKVYLVVGE